MTSSDPRPPDADAQVFVSIVTPFHNTDAYLGECIESVLAQTHANFEYVLVDNASTDHSSEIAARYAASDPRIRLLRTDRLLPQIENYNFALSQMSARSRYCKMVQADDWIYPRCVEEMVGLAMDHPGVSLVSSYRLDGDELDGGGLAVDQSVLDGTEAGRMHLLSSMWLFGTQTTVLYRADLVRGRPEFFAPDVFQTDADAAYRLLDAGDFGFVHQVLSYSRSDERSIASQRLQFNPRELDFLVAVMRHGQRFLEDDEQRALLARTMTKYRTSLATGWIRNRRRGDTAQLWLHHRQALAAVGVEIGRRDLALGFLGAFLKALRSTSRAFTVANRS